MYIGHYGVAYALKKKNKQIPLWLLFIAVQFSDLLAFLLIILGIEKIQYTGGENPFFRTVIEYLPYSHSLIFNLIYALIIFLFFLKFKKKLWGMVLSIALLSHWFIDLLFQDNNLPIFFDNYKIGFGLWNFPIFSFFSEIIFIIITAYYIYKEYKIKSVSFFGLNLVMILYFSFIIFVPEPQYIQDSSALKALVILIPYLLFTSIIYLIEKKEKFGQI